MRSLGNRHKDTLTSINNLGALLVDQGDLTTAASLLRDALQVSRKTRGNRHPDHLISIDNIGAVL